ncbi:CRISPR-associated protein CasA/Cse1 [Mycobacterium simulans]|uniref:type I-E CRISPR-associated protein Cse1/CasA n=1 Tax=Mycobacterium simulans TaxID=627089 RepID=UPI00174A74FE|nr:type I-E CRISPR-associated protein Cse1/CasA [Mycobacterium simulans]SON62627.1 CRISPR-associated protein CasA/Cse1 [Mycobacterium simulans]
MTDNGSFNLIDEPWIIVLDNAGREALVSILQLFQCASDFASVGGELPTQAFAITRMLLAFLHRALEGPRSREQWHELWTADGLPIEKIERYADRVRHRFDLFDSVAPFFQVAELHTSKDEVSGLEKMVGDVPNGAPFFTTRSAASLERISAAEAARWLVHTHAFDPSGIKSGAVGDPTVKGGKGYPIGTGWSGQVGAVLATGRNLRETLVLNLIARDVETYVRVGTPDDLPPWEREPDGPSWEERSPHGAIELYTWQTRRVRLTRDGGDVVGVVLANGDKIASQNRHGLEPHTAWRYSEPQTKKLKTTVYMPLLHDPNRSVWRGIAALLPSVNGRRGSTSSEPQRFLAPGVLQWISDLVAQGYLPDNYRPAIHVCGAQYGDQNATIGDVIDDELPLAIMILREDQPAAGRTAVEAVADAEHAASEVWKLAENIAQAAGAEPKSGAGDSARELLYVALEEPYRRWVAALMPGVDLDGARRRWREVVVESVRLIADDVVSAAPPSAWVGREIRNRAVNVAVAETWFHAALRRLLPTVHDHPSNPKLEEAAS